MSEQLKIKIYPSFVKKLKAFIMDHMPITPVTMQSSSEAIENGIQNLKADQAINTNFEEYLP
jgi:hypothetical protein